jgi:non-specific serine/threonine protein kinase
VRAATAAVAFAPIDEYEVPELLWSLVDKSLVVVDPSANETRYRLLESVRAFAMRRLDNADEIGTTGRRAAAWYLERVGAARRFGRGWASDVAVDIDNLRALIPLLAVHAQESAQQLAYILARYHDRVDSYRTGIDELTHQIASLPEPTATRVSLFSTLADLHLRLGNIEAARRALSDAEELAAAVGGPHEWDDVAIERTRGEIACRSGNHASAIEAAQRTLTRDLSTRGRARMWSQIGIAAHGLGNIELAHEAFRHEYDLNRELNDDYFVAAAAGNLAEVEMGRGDYTAAARYQQASMELGLELGAPVPVGFAIVVASRLAAMRRDWATAATLHGNFQVVLETTGIVLYDADQRVVDETVKNVRDHLGDDEFDAACREGADLGLPEAAALARKVLEAVANE